MVRALGFKMVKLIDDDRYESPVLVSPYVLNGTKDGHKHNYSPIIYAPHKRIKAQNWCGHKDCTSGIWWQDFRELKFGVILYVLKMGTTYENRGNYRSSSIYTGRVRLIGYPDEGFLCKDVNRKNNNKELYFLSEDTTQEILYRYKLINGELLFSKY